MDSCYFLTFMDGCMTAFSNTHPVDLSQVTQWRLLRMRMMMSHRQKRTSRQVARSSYVNMHTLFREGYQIMNCSSLLIPYFLCSDGASLGPTRKDGKKASCRTGQQNGEIPMSGRGKPDAETTLAQEWKRVQKRPPHWGLQGTFAPEQT